MKQVLVNLALIGVLLSGCKGLNTTKEFSPTQTETSSQFPQISFEPITPENIDRLVEVTDYYFGQLTFGKFLEQNRKQMEFQIEEELADRFILVSDPVQSNFLTTLRHLFLFYSSELSPDASMVTIYSPGYPLQIWDIENKKLLFEFESEEKLPRVFWSPDSSMLVADIGEDQLLLWDRDEGKNYQIRENIGWSSQTPWSPDGTQLAFCDNGAIHIWHADTKTYFREFVGAAGDESSLCSNIKWSYDGAMFVEHFIDKSLLEKGDFIFGDSGERIWNIRTGEVLSENTKAQSQWSPVDHRIALYGTLSFDHPADYIEIWEMDELEFLFTIPTRTFYTPIFSVHWSADGARLFVTDAYEGYLSVYDSSYGQKLQEYILKMGYLFWSPTREVFAAPGNGAEVYIFDGYTGEWLGEMEAPDSNYGLSIFWSPDGSCFAMAHARGWRIPQIWCVPAE